MVNRLSVNMDKTNFIMFHPYNKPINHTITLKFQKNAIMEKNCIKYLGIMIDSTLTWHTHIDNISKKMLRAIGLLYKIRRFVNMNVNVHPHLTYAIEVWGSAGIKILNRLLVLQKG